MLYIQTVEPYTLELLKKLMADKDLNQFVLEKLELNWIGKNNEFQLEPRILIEKPQSSMIGEKIML